LLRKREPTLIGIAHITFLERRAPVKSRGRLARQGAAHRSPTVESTF